MQWLQRSVRPNLDRWQFNTVGFDADVVGFESGRPQFSDGLTFAQLQAIGLPYGFAIPFDLDRAERERGQPFDYRSDAFASHCDRVAKTYCLPMASDPNLLGYWYADRPRWDAPRFADSRVRGEQAAAYYQTIREAIRRHDLHHLLLGDRYDAGRSLSATVVRAALPHVDVLCVNCVGEGDDVHRQLARMAEVFDRPILVSDHAIDRKPHDGEWPPRQNRFHDAAGYARTLRTLTAIPQVVGYHLCGGYIRNAILRRGLMDENERQDRLAIDGIRNAHAMLADWVKATAD